jgi:hypothetical protein
MVIWATTGMSRVHVARRADGLADLLEVAEGLDDEQVRAAFLERGHLLGERGARSSWLVGP